MPVNGINVGEFIRQVFGYKVIYSFKHERFHLLSTSVSEAIPFKGMKNRGRASIPARPCNYACSPVL